MTNLHLFTGENDYLRTEERRRWISEFQKKHGSENCIVLDGSKLSIRSLLDEVSVLPFLAEKRLIVVDGVPKSTKEEIELLVENIHPQSVVLIVDSKPDKRTGGVKTLLQIADIKEFPPLQPKKLAEWAVAYVTQHGSSIAPAALEAMLQATGNDQMMIATELDKLSLFATGKTITADDIERMTIESDEGVVWRMTDLLCAGNTAASARITRQMMERGVSGFQLWGILLSFLQNVVLVRAAVEEGMTSAKQVSDATGVHVFALRSLQPYASRVRSGVLYDFVTWAVRADMALKTGKTRATEEFPQELHAVIDQFLARCPVPA